MIENVSEITDKANELLGLKGKVAVITGAASGIGLATSELLSELGADVVMVDIDTHSGLKASEQIAEKGGKAAFIKCDVTSSTDCKNIAEQIEKDYGKIDILFNNAGVIRRKNVVHLGEKDWDIVLNVSLKGVYLLSKFIIPVMAKNGGGSIINTGSGWGLKGGDNAAAYCAAKAGVVNLTKAMAIDHGPQNIRVNCVCPGDTDTPLLRDEAKQLQEDEQSFLVSSAHGRPLERLGTPEDIAKTVLYLASELSSWVSGTVVTVDGGGLA
ncbi:NAD(P)-dependent dehydrogenase (short-subunit alcohol dehydrogenase family) [Scopulibacillus darangshiensis]|uniref:NAD(P)-dependent dehydrogenase (Short-subunit alcohol dehydrogenase family) n=1 Tax=Scopulibacillus darangshiensis TaxID=442528 RepID=A0A4R2P471_9BACL|nr:SDR family oxidoreductase [Scopulibacillus darangshiensis]TCP29609.1 NAD(P)-dependent dehydrogenase (short-subunit alcohol dehydrogenase family) [Scopulibacillus darangshiensis]